MNPNISIQVVYPHLGTYALSNDISKQDIKKLAEYDKLTGIQFVKPVVDNNIWKNLETYIFSKRPDVQLRVYGHYLEKCDFSFLQYVPSVRDLSADSLRECVNVEQIALLENLEVLGLGVFSLESFEFMNDISPKLKSLFIGLTKSKKPDISVISRFKDLKYLYIEGQHKGIEVISELENLEKIVLRSISTENLDYLRNLKKLWSVDIKLGGIKDFSALMEMSGIKYLELWQVRKLLDISFISKLTDLQNLFLHSLPHIEKIPDLSANEKLRRVYFDNLKGLKNIDSLEHVKNLEESIFINCPNIQPESLIPVFKNQALKAIHAGFACDDCNKKLKEYIKKYRKVAYEFNEFVYK